MNSSSPESVICRYSVKPGRDREMERLLAKHWPALNAEGLVTDEPSLVYRSRPKTDGGAAASSGTVYVEIFTWKSAEAPEAAHQLPGVMAVWEPMGAICDTMEFPHFERITPAKS